MNAYAFRLARAGLFASPILFLASCATSPQQDAGAVLARASQAMGAAQLNTLRYTAEGTGYTFGQAYKAGGAWPKITLHSVTRSIDYGSGTMREEVVLSRAEPLGGGGYPLAGQQRNAGFVSGELAWNVAGGNAAPAPRAVGDRIHQLWITPHGAIKAAMRSGGAIARPGEGGTSVVSFEVASRLMASVTIGADGLLSRIDSVYPDPVLGEAMSRSLLNE